MRFFMVDIIIEGAPIEQEKTKVVMRKIKESDKNAKENLSQYDKVFIEKFANRDIVDIFEGYNKLIDARIKANDIYGEIVKEAEKFYYINDIFDEYLENCLALNGDNYAEFKKVMGALMKKYKTSYTIMRDLANNAVKNCDYILKNSKKILTLLDKNRAMIQFDFDIEDQVSKTILNAELLKEQCNCGMEEARKLMRDDTVKLERVQESLRVSQAQSQK